MKGGGLSNDENLEKLGAEKEEGEEHDEEASSIRSRQEAKKRRGEQVSVNLPGDEDQENVQQRIEHDEEEAGIRRGREAKKRRGGWEYSNNVAVKHDDEKASVAISRAEFKDPLINPEEKQEDDEEILDLKRPPPREQFTESPERRQLRRRGYRLISSPWFFMFHDHHQNIYLWFRYSRRPDGSVGINVVASNSHPRRTLNGRVVPMTPIEHPPNIVREFDENQIIGLPFHPPLPPPLLALPPNTAWFFMFRSPRTGRSLWFHILDHQFILFTASHP